MLLIIRISFEFSRIYFPKLRQPGPEVAASAIYALVAKKCGLGLLYNRVTKVMRVKIQLLDDVGILQHYLSSKCSRKVRRLKLLLMGLFDMQMSEQWYTFESMQNTVSNHLNVLGNLSRSIMGISNLAWR